MKTFLSLIAALLALTAHAQTTNLLTGTNYQIENTWQLIILTNPADIYAYQERERHSAPLWIAFEVDGIVYMNGLQRDLSQPEDGPGTIWTTNQCESMYGVRIQDGIDQELFMNQVTKDVEIMSNYDGTLTIGTNHFTVKDLESLRK